LLAVLGFLVVDVLIQTTMGKGLGPVLAGRPLPWLVLQLLSLGAVAATIGTAVAWWRHRTPRLAVSLAGGVVFVPWAIYWGLLAI
jgi:hypothetical protein